MQDQLNIKEYASVFAMGWSIFVAIQANVFIHGFDFQYYEYQLGALALCRD
jgi:hypothetical protein